MLPKQALVERPVRLGSASKFPDLRGVLVPIRGD
jgi:hypothetical protein